MKLLFALTSVAVMAACATPANAQADICLGVNCDNTYEGRFQSYAPGINASDIEWEQFGELTGLLGGIAAHREGKDYKSCLTHCTEHADEAEETCQANRPYGGFKACTDVWKKSYESCIPHCQTLPH